jgi:trimeric autotransporter adhesin
MMKNRIILVITFFLCLVFMIACGGQEMEQDDDLENGLITPGGHIDAKSITAFSFTDVANEALSSDVTASINGTTITVAVPNGTDVTTLVATFTTSGTSVTISGVSQVSGTTANDFNNAVTYTVTAADNTTRNYVVTVTLGALFGSAIFGTDRF